MDDSRSSELPVDVRVNRTDEAFMAITSISTVVGSGARCTSYGESDLVMERAITLCMVQL